MTRFAIIADLPRIMAMLESFGREAWVGFRSPTAQDRERLQRMVLAWITNHYVRVALNQDQVCGMIIAERGQDFWDPERVLLQERVWWIEPHCRNSRISAKLWQAWQQDSDQYVRSGRVQGVLLSTQAAHTDFDPGRRGWRLIEQIWIKE